MLCKDLIKQIRIKCGITQSVLSEWTKIDQQSISLYERGLRKPGLLVRHKIIKIANEKAGMNVKDSDIND
jgi:DNA-binding XRE family transcriptional regulator